MDITDTAVDTAVDAAWEPPEISSESLDDTGTFFDGISENDTDV
jgi:hypothetical protein